MKEDFKLLRLSEVMQITGLSRFTLYRQMKKGVLPAKKFGKHWFVNEKDLKKIFNQQQEEKI